MNSLLLTIAAAMVLVWAGIVLARGALVVTALLLLLAGSCFGDPFFRVSALGVPLSVERLLLVVLLAQYAVYRRWGLIELKTPRAADYLLAALLVVLVLSTLVHDFRADRWGPLAALALFYLMPAAIYWVARQADWTARTAWWTCGAWAAFGLYLSLTVVAATQGARALVRPQYIVSPMFGEYDAAARGPFLNPAVTGLIVTLAMCAALVFWPRASWLGKVLVVLLVGVYLTGIYSTMSPSVGLGAAAALAVLGLLATPVGWRAPLVGTTLVAMLVAVGLSWPHVRAFVVEKQRAITSTPAGPAATTAAQADRAPLVAAWQLFLDRPILGCGLGHYGRELPAYVSKPGDKLPLNVPRLAPPNVWVRLLVETGLLGTGLFVALLSSWTFTAWKLWHASLAPCWLRQMGLLFLAWIAAYAAGASFHDLSTAPMANMFLFFLGGTVMGASVFLDIPPARGSVQLRSPKEQPQLVAY